MYGVVEYDNSGTDCMGMSILHVYEDRITAFKIAKRYAKKYAKDYNKANGCNEHVVEYVERNYLTLPQSGPKYTIKGGVNSMVYTVMYLPDPEDIIRLDNSESEESE